MLTLISGSPLAWSARWAPYAKLYSVDEDCGDVSGKTTPTQTFSFS